MKQLLIAIFIFLSIISTFLVADGNRDPSFEFSYNSSEIQVDEGVLECISIPYKRVSLDRLRRWCY